MNAPQVPRTLGPYRILGRLGVGATGLVYRAVREDAPDEPVAVKVLEVGADDAERLARLQREAELLRDHPHPDLVPILAAQLEVAPRYLVFPLLSGGSLEPYTSQDRPLPPSQVLTIAAAVARALAHLHARGIVHRDVKPGNILLDENGRAQLADLGMGRGRGQEKLTRTGDLVGTPIFLPPEVWLDPDRGQDPAGDVYALGVTLVWLLAGECPSRGPGHLDVPWERIRAHRIDGLPRLVADLLAAGVSGDRPDAATAARRLEELASGAPATVSLDGVTRSALHPRPPAALTPGPTPSSRRIRAMAILCLLVAVSLATLATLAARSPRGPRILPAPVGPAESAPAPSLEWAATTPAVRGLGAGARPVAITVAGNLPVVAVIVPIRSLPLDEVASELVLVALTAETAAPRPSPRVSLHAGGPAAPELLQLVGDVRGVAALLAGPYLVLLDGELSPGRVLGAASLGGGARPLLLGMTRGHAWLAIDRTVLAVSRGAENAVHSMLAAAPLTLGVPSPGGEGLLARSQGGAWVLLSDGEDP